MTDARGAEPCYRHPNRPTWVLCQRCGNPLCGKCQVPAAVGVQCAECVDREKSWQKEVHGATRRAQGKPARPNRLRQLVSRPQGVTLTIIGLTVIVSLLGFFSGSVGGLLAFQADYAVIQPWRLVTAALLHGGILHLALNMLALWMLGPALEERFGKLPFLTMYIVMAIAGNVAVPWLGSGNIVIGASGAVFGLFGVYLGVQRMVGRVDPQLLIIVGINLVYGFFVSGIAWQAHIGGLVAGFIIGFGTVWFARNRQEKIKAPAWAAISIAAVITGVLWVLWVLL